MSYSVKQILLSSMNRLTSLVAVMLGVSFLTFLLYYYSPGDKAQAIGHARYGGEGDIQPEIAAQIREEYGLDKPLFSQFVHWLRPLLEGDFGKSFVSREDVWIIFVPNVIETLTLATTSLLIGLVLAFMLSVLSVWKPGSFVDRLAIGLASVGAAIPHFWLGLLLILLFSATLKWLPAYGSGSFKHLILPATTLSLWVMTSQTRLFRSFLLEAKAAPYLEALRLRGVTEAEIFWRHILRHAMIPAITMIGVDLAGLLEGAVIVEVIFSRNGIGSLFIHSILSRDYPVIMFLVLFTAFTYVLINTLVELAQDWLTPIKDLKIKNNYK